MQRENSNGPRQDFSSLRRFASGRRKVNKKRTIGRALMTAPPGPSLRVTWQHDFGEILERLLVCVPTTIF
jgi:hypothetical protein